MWGGALSAVCEEPGQDSSFDGNVLHCEKDIDKSVLPKYLLSLTGSSILTDLTDVMDLTDMTGG